MYCYRSVLSVGLWLAVFMGVCVCGGLLPRWLEIACIDLQQTGSVGKGSDHLQLIKIWLSCPPREGGLWWCKHVWVCLTTASVQCLLLSERFFSLWIAFLKFVNTCWLTGNRWHTAAGLQISPCVNSTLTWPMWMRQSDYIVEPPQAQWRIPRV